MNSRLIFLLSAVLIFLSTSVLTYSQDKPNTTNKTTRQTQEKQITKTSGPHQVKTVIVKSAKEKATDQKMVKKSGRVNTKKVENAKVLKHHKKMERKIQKKESKNASQKK